MAAQQRKRRKAESKTEQQPFRRNAFLLIDTMLHLNNQAPDEAPDEAKRALVDEILHSIFFLGKIRNPSVPPENFLSDDEMLNGLKERFPRPFELYSSQLPRRSPFSCVLDMIVLLLGRQNETLIIDGLRNVISDLKPGESRALVPSTVCVSNKPDNKDQVKYYGVSISAATGSFTNRFMIDASCLSSWDRYVAGAVMSYDPIQKTKKRNFDGTIKLPPHVRCEAFDLFNTNTKDPCRLCVNMFGLETETETETGWFYGNCAEVESLSNLFNNEVDVKEQSRRPSGMYLDEEREGVEKQVRDDLRNRLKNHKFMWKNEFYSPQ